MDNKEKIKLLTEEYNKLNQAVTEGQIRMQRIIGKIELLNELDKEKNDNELSKN